MGSVLLFYYLQGLQSQGYLRHQNSLLSISILQHSNLQEGKRYRKEKAKNAQWLSINEDLRLPCDTFAYIPLVKTKWHGYILLEGRQGYVVLFHVVMNPAKICTVSYHIEGKNGHKRQLVAFSKVSNWVFSYSEYSYLFQKRCHCHYSWTAFRTCNTFYTYLQRCQILSLEE